MKVYVVLCRTEPSEEEEMCQADAHVVGVYQSRERAERVRDGHPKMRHNFDGVARVSVWEQDLLGGGLGPVPDTSGPLPNRLEVVKPRRHVHEWEAGSDKVLRCVECPATVLRCSDVRCYDLFVGEGQAQCPKCGARSMEDAA